MPTPDAIGSTKCCSPQIYTLSDPDKHKDSHFIANHRPFVVPSHIVCALGPIKPNSSKLSSLRNPQQGLHSASDVDLNILLVEDDDGDAAILRGLLRRQRNTVTELDHVVSLGDALNYLESKKPDVILLDMNLPDSSGINTVTSLQEAHPNLPLVVLSGQDNEDFAVEILNHGVQDYLVKWEGNAQTILRSIRYAIERKRTDLRLNHLAHFDRLTNLPNRQYFQEQLEAALNRANRGNHKVALFFLDLDNFKTINDTLGHHAGDELLVNATNSLQSILRTNDTLARLGGDEFAVIAEEINGPMDAQRIGERLLQALRRPCSIEGRDIKVSASIGVALYPDDTKDRIALLKNADIAMYQAKINGRDALHFFTQNMQKKLMDHHRMTNELREAIDSDQLFLEYQPKFDLSNRLIVGSEALVRWQHPERGRLAPAEFISLAETNGQIADLGAWVLSRACKQIALWISQGLAVPQMSVNVSPIQFSQPDFVTEVQATLGKYEVPPELIQLELTETLLMEDSEHLQDTLKRLKSLGLQLAIDDFGTGYSCLQYLRSFPVDVLKIDKSFVSDIGTSRDGDAICAIIISIARQLQLEPVAEGLETEEQLKFLTDHNCTIGQGFLLAKPMPAEELELHFRPDSSDRTLLRTSNGS